VRPFCVGPDRRPEGPPALDVHAGGRLVEQEQRRVGEQRHREPQSLLLTTGALGNLAVCDAVDARPSEHVVNRVRAREEAGGVLHGLADGQVLEQPPGLHHR